MMLPNFFHMIVLLLYLYLDRVLTAPLADLERDDGVLVRTVPHGSTVVLKCTSNDAAHSFQYWHLLEKGTIIGPTNPYDPAKFKYEILTGNLTIRGVSKEEEGLYECVSRSVRGEDLNIRVVRMVVKSNFPEVYEDLYNIKVIRILIGLITMVLVSMGAWFVYRIWKDRYRYPRYIGTEDEDDDESTEELFTQQPGTSKPEAVNTHDIVPGKTKKQTEMAFDDVDISTDFKSIMDTSNEK